MGSVLDIQSDQNFRLPCLLHWQGKVSQESLTTGRASYGLSIAYKNFLTDLNTDKLSDKHAPAHTPATEPALAPETAHAHAHALAPAIVTTQTQKPSQKLFLNHKTDQDKPRD